MRKLLIMFSLALLPLFASAQQSSVFGYFSFDEVLHAMPAYSIAQQNMKDLKTKYAQEADRVEKEFNVKYEDFLDVQATLAPSIREKRQAELRELMEKNIAFKENSQRLLDQAEKDALAPLKAKINEALHALGTAKSLDFIVNTDGGNVPFINPEKGENLTEALKNALK